MNRLQQALLKPIRLQHRGGQNITSPTTWEVSEPRLMVQMERF